MSFFEVRALTSNLVGLFLILSGIELLFLSRSKRLLAVWESDFIRNELSKALPFHFLSAWLSSQQSLRQLALAEVILATAVLIFPSAPLFFFVFCVHLLVCIRFLGTFNGGSDQMILILLTGLFFAYVFSDVRLAKFGLVYIAVQLLYSYFKAGLAKLKNQNWRNGSALLAFAQASPYAEVRKRLTSFQKWRFSGFIGVIGSWMVIVFELTAWLSPFLNLTSSLRLIWLYLGVAFVFHLAIYFVFGLNRFFWTWMAAWPSVFYLSIFA